MRPGRRPGTRERSLIRAVGSRGGLALVCDDPPGTGASIARVAASLEGFGVPRRSILLLLALFPDTEELAPALAGYESVLLRFDDWSIHTRLGVDAVRDTVERLLGPDRELVAAERLSVRSPRSVRGHLGAVFKLTLADAHGGGHEELQLSVEGVGLGYFGNHAIAVADPLREYFPSVLGVAGRPAVPRVDARRRARRSAAVERSRRGRVARSRGMSSNAIAGSPLEQDVTLRQSGQYPAWEAASTVLSRSFGRAWPAGRKLLTDRVAKRLLHVQSPSDVDGRLELTRWFADAGPGQHRQGRLGPGLVVESRARMLRPGVRPRRRHRGVAGHGAVA